MNLGRRRDRRLQSFALGIAALVLAAIFVPTREQPYQFLCLPNVKQLGLAELMYAQDYDDHLTPAGGWLDIVGSYTKGEHFRCPAVPETTDGKPSVGYAFNAWLSRRHEEAVQDPSHTIMIYDSTNLLPNATDPVTSLPEPGRHHGRDTVAFLDGHATTKLPDQAGIACPRIVKEVVKAPSPKR